MTTLKTPRLLLAALLGLSLSGALAAQTPMGMGSGPHMMRQDPGVMGGGPYGPMMGYGMGMMQGGPMMGYGMGMMPCPMTNSVQGGPGYGVPLDEAQQKKMNEIREQLWQVQQTHMQEMQAHQQEMMQLYQDGTPDNEHVLQAHKQMQKLQLKMLEARLKAQEDMNKVLTKEQRQQMLQMQRHMYRGWQ